MIVSKSMLVDIIWWNTDLPRITIEAVVDGLLETIQRRALSGDKIIIRNFGTFSQAHRAERKVRNPATGAESIAPASSTLKFKAAKPK